VLLFDSAATYLVQTQIDVLDRHNLVFEGDGCQFVRTFEPFCGAQQGSYPLLSATRGPGGQEQIVTYTLQAGNVFNYFDTYSAVSVAGCTPSIYNTTGAGVKPVEVLSSTSWKADLGSDPGSDADVTTGVAQKKEARNALFVLNAPTGLNQPCTGITLRNFTFTGSHDQAGVDGHVAHQFDYEYDRGIVWFGAEDSLIDNVVVEKVGGPGFYFWERNISGTLYPCKNITMRNSRAYWCGRQSWALGNIDGGYFYDNTIDDAGAGMIDIEPTASLAYMNILIDGLTVDNGYNSGGYFISAGGTGSTNYGPITVKNVTITRDEPAQTQGLGFLIKGTVGDGAVKRGPLTLQNITMTGLGDAASGGTWAAIWLNNWEQVLIENVDVTLTYLPARMGGLKLTDSDSVTVSGSSFTDCYDYGGTPSWYGDAGGNTNINIA
jgi:hypothetical protein